MAIHPIISLPDPRLRQRSEEVAEVTDEVRALLDDMLETMYDAPGIGLAAIQIGVAKRLVVIDVSKDEEARSPIRMVNPQVVWQSEESSTHEEGCLSIPDFYEEVQRPARCRVRYLDEAGVERELDCEGLLATCVQHEIDHLNGVLFIDHISRLKRERVTRKFAKAAKRGERPQPARPAALHPPA